MPVAIFSYVPDAAASSQPFSVQFVDHQDVATVVAASEGSSCVSRLAADLLHEQINFPTVLPNEPGVVNVDKAPRPVHEAEGDCAAARFLPFQLETGAVVACCARQTAELKPSGTQRQQRHK